MGDKLGLISSNEAWQDYEAKQARAVALEKVLATRKVDASRAQLNELFPEMGNVAGQTYGQLLKRPEISAWRRLLPILRA